VKQRPGVVEFGQAPRLAALPSAMDFLAALSHNEPRGGSKPKLLGIGRIANWSSSKQGIMNRTSSKRQGQLVVSKRVFSLAVPTSTRSNTT
jgi:hypothetical protein